MQINIAFIAQTYKLFAEKKVFVKKILLNSNQIEYFILIVAKFAIQFEVKTTDNLQFFYIFVLLNLKKCNYYNVD